MKTGKSVEILLIEDNPGDIVLTREAFSDAKISNHIHVAKDGEEALEYLRKQNSYADAITPDIILLDLNLPKLNGHEVLAEIKEDKELRRIPVVVLTSSKAERDILDTCELHANSYIVKPVDLSKFMEVVSAIEHFWFTVVALPHEHDD